MGFFNDNHKGKDEYTIQELQEMADRGVAPVVGTCGHEVEPDGECPCGNVSYLRHLGLT